MNSNNNIHFPVDISNIELTPEILALADALSKNMHEVWVAERMSEGWSYGPVRDDAMCQTPCLVPYDELPETEKAYEWNTAATTLKHIVALGFEIKKKP